MDKEDLNKMYFPITVIDNFYNDFDKIKKMANEALYLKREFATMPGEATQAFHISNQPLFHLACNKVLSLFYGRHYEQGIASAEYVVMKFEKITPFAPEYSKEGWIHFDDNNKLTGIYYVQGDSSEGTSFYKHKEVGVPEFSGLQFRHKLYSGETISPEEYNSELKKHNEQFEHILTVPCVPNRLVLFDSSIYHKAEGTGSHEKPRVIQTMFFKDIFAETFPIPDMKRIG